MSLDKCVDLVSGSHAGSLEGFAVDLEAIDTCEKCIVNRIQLLASHYASRVAVVVRCFCRESDELRYYALSESPAKLRYAGCSVAFLGFVNFEKTPPLGRCALVIPPPRGASTLFWL